MKYSNWFSEDYDGGDDEDEDGGMAGSAELFRR